MKLRFKLDGTKITRAKACELAGKERLERMIKESRETMKEDPLIENDYWLGAGVGMLTIEMDPWA